VRFTQVIETASPMTYAGGVRGMGSAVAIEAVAINRRYSSCDKARGQGCRIFR
jgi:hypothetical protein